MAADIFLPRGVGAGMLTAAVAGDVFIHAALEAQRLGERLDAVHRRVHQIP